METKKHTIRLTPDTAKRLKVLAARAGLTQGRLLELFLSELMDAGFELTPDQYQAACDLVYEFTFGKPRGAVR